MGTNTMVLIIVTAMAALVLAGALVVVVKKTRTSQRLVKGTTIHDQAEVPGTALIVMLAVLVACWLADGSPAIICGLAAAVVGPVAEILIVELGLAMYSPLADSLFGVALWLPALYFAFGVVVARLAELLVARRELR